MGKTLDKKPDSVADLPVWNFDGSSTGQAPGDDSEVLLKPVAIFADPFRGGENILVMCECMTPKMEAIPTNTREAAKAAFDQKLDEKPWFGIEQEYTLFEKDGRTPLGWPAGGFPGPQGPDRQVQLRSCEPRSICAHSAFCRGRWQGLLRGSPSGLQHGSLCRDIQAVQDDLLGVSSETASQTWEQEERACHDLGDTRCPSQARRCISIRCHANLFLHGSARAAQLISL